GKIVVCLTNHFWVAVERIFQEHDTRFIPNYVMDSVEAIRTLLENSTDFIAFLPKLSVAREVSSGKLAILPLRSSNLPTQTGVLLFHPDHGKTGLIRSFLQVVHESRNDLPDWLKEAFLETPHGADDKAVQQSFLDSMNMPNGLPA